MVEFSFTCNEVEENMLARILRDVAWLAQQRLAFLSFNRSRVRLWDARGGRHDLRADGGGNYSKRGNRGEVDPVRGLLTMKDPLQCPKGDGFSLNTDDAAPLESPACGDTVSDNNG